MVMRGSYYLEKKGAYQARCISGGNATGTTINGSGSAVTQVALSGAAITAGEIKYVTVIATVDTYCVQTSEKGAAALTDEGGSASYFRLPKNTAWPLIVKNDRDYLQMRAVGSSAGRLDIAYHEPAE